MTYGTPTVVATLLGATFTDVQTQQCQGFLDRAERLILSRIPNLAALISAGTVNADDVADVEQSAARRVMLNPLGKDNEKLDDYSYGLTDSVAQSEVVILDDEWAQILRSSQSSGAFSIGLSGAGPHLVGGGYERHRRWPPFS